MNKKKLFIYLWVPILKKKAFRKYFVGRITDLFQGMFLLSKITQEIF